MNYRKTSWAFGAIITVQSLIMNFKDHIKCLLYKVNALTILTNRYSQNSKTTKILTTDTKLTLDS